MPRTARVIAENGIYHVVNRGNGRAVVFRKPADFDTFVHLIGEAKARYPVKVIAYCLMSNITGAGDALRRRKAFFGFLFVAARTKRKASGGTRPAGFVSSLV